MDPWTHLSAGRKRSLDISAFYEVPNTLIVYRSEKGQILVHGAGFFIVCFVCELRHIAYRQFRSVTEPTDPLVNL